MTWYVIAEYRHLPVKDDDTVWTVSEDQTKPGWETDGGYTGYGLTKAKAQHLATAANLYEAAEVASS